MSHGIPTPEQCAVIERAVKGRAVHDLGAGDLFLTYKLLTLGAAQVVAIDQRFDPVIMETLPNGLAESRSQRLVIKQITFEAYASNLTERVIDVAFVSWPNNHRQEHGLVKLLSSAKTIVYLGSNSDCNQCGGPRMFELFAKRTLVEHVPSRRNTLLVLGEPIQARRLTGEELAGAVAWVDGTRPLSFEELQRINGTF